jgi:hypothetical protein
VLANLHTVAGYLKQYGWRYEAHGDDLLVTGFRGKNGVFRVFIQITDPWISLTILPFVPRPVPACRERFYRYVLRLNFDMNLCKLGADEEEDISLGLQLHGEDLRFEDLGAGLDALAYYADGYYVALLSLARDPQFGPPIDLGV